MSDLLELELPNVGTANRTWDLRRVANAQKQALSHSSSPIFPFNRKENTEHLCISQFIISVPYYGDALIIQ